MSQDSFWRAVCRWTPDWHDTIRYHAGPVSANSGGAWDNAKKLVESEGIEGYGKGSDVHASTIVGDTVGDPLKDTVGPSLDILIKIMAVISLIMVSVFGEYNLLDLFM